jgi:ABC-type glycerol-3-phosphate transport system substrate-binding protein
MDEMIAADGYSLSDFPPAALDGLSDGGRIWGLPYRFVSNVLIYRADLFDKHGIAVPQTLDELTAAAVAVQEAERGAGNSDFYGMAIRGAPNCELNFWIIGSTWGPSYGARWYDDDGRPTLATPELIGAVEHYVDLARRAGPPEEPTMDFMDCMRIYGDGRAAMTIEPANEASILYDENGAVADATRTALMPAGPLGTRHVGLYSPPYAIPSRSRSKAEAWELAKFLCSPEQVLDDVQRSGFVEVARESVLNDSAFEARSRPELLPTVRETRPFARGERPVTNFGMEVGNLIGDEIVRVLRGEIGAQEAPSNAERTVAALGAPG